MFTMYHQNAEDVFDLQMFADKVEKLEGQDVHLWGINRNVYNEQKNYSEYFLDEDEQNRTQRFRFSKNHDLFVIGRYYTKIMLAYYTMSHPESIKIIPDSFGKPTSERNLFFNISHSGDQLLVGFSKSKIGVDIERNDPAVDIEKVGKSHFSEVELQEMMSYTRDERTEAFFEIWTKKEALIKGIGKGLSIPLQDFNVTKRNGKVFWKFPADNKYGNWYVHNIETKQGFKSAFATQNDVANASYFCLDS